MKKAKSKMSSPSKLKDRDLSRIDPCKQQFEPTPQSPVPQHYKMAGGA